MHRASAGPFSLLAACLAAFGCSSSPEQARPARTLGFDDGSLADWSSEATGGSGPLATWEVRADPAAASAPNVVALSAPNHASDDRFNLLWNRALEFRDGELSVAVRADGGEVDQGGGPMWRVQDANNYYVCRFNPLEANYRVYVVVGGVRKQLATALIGARVGQWHRIDVQHVGSLITCALDGRKFLEVSDETIARSGGVGLWTKADAQTSFDDLAITGPQR